MGLRKRSAVPLGQHKQHLRMQIPAGLSPDWKTNPAPWVTTVNQLLSISFPPFLSSASWASGVRSDIRLSSPLESGLCTLHSPHCTLLSCSPFGILNFLPAPLGLPGHYSARNLFRKLLRAGTQRAFCKFYGTEADGASGIVSPSVAKFSLYLCVYFQNLESGSLF